jgi:hypothetical protein
MRTHVLCALDGFVAAAIAGGLCVGSHASAAQTANIAGSYVHARGVAAQMEIERRGEQYIVSLSGGGRANGDAASPADCYIRAVGRQTQGVLDAHFVAVETETFLYTPARAAREKRALQISFAPGAAAVTRADTEGYCGRGATFLGPYRRAGDTARPPRGQARKR